MCVSESLKIYNSLYFGILHTIESFLKTEINMRYRPNSRTAETTSTASLHVFINGTAILLLLSKLKDHSVTQYC